MGLAYCGLGLAGEAGEVANEIKKILRDDSGQLTASRKAKLIDELGDVAWYLAMCCTELNMDIVEVMRQNLDKLAERYHK